ncbi:DUF305 domain-containing protein [Williamsia sterculiae]|uniref:Uncharacterized conserved protein, DUF305 family n=1 Tax=Williamsia sterculiae TaxID=1344003 RepID=A0A1N7E214_9NOCA|nr:DUF305 domain-containing protein [Williamsia sterculiae]SIR82103.1 Uncharacterized conserved protein, DUF305 family [Williamsia sterculiae]
MPTDTENPDSADTEPGRTAQAPSRGWRRQLPAVFGLGAIALLLIGVGVGLLVQSSLSDRDGDDRPAADSAAVGFAQDMVRHHQQGVEMATIELYNGSDPAVRNTAYDILTQQTNQVGQMQSWLSRWGYPADNPGTPMAWMKGDHDMHGMSMPGMSMPATSQSTMPSGSMSSGGAETPPMPGMAVTSEMDKLRALRGQPLDLYFMQLMLRHHQGGLPMMRYAADKAHVSEGYVRDLAQQMVSVQQNEVQTLTQMIAERGGTPLSMN